MLQAEPAGDGSHVRSAAELLDWLHDMYKHMDLRGGEWERAATSIVQSRPTEVSVSEHVGQILMLADYIKDMGRDEQSLRQAYHRELSG